jgi:hypothetical protein
VAWETHIYDEGTFRVKVDPTSDQYVYEEKQVLKDKLNALAADEKYYRETHGLKYWSGYPSRLGRSASVS